MITYHSTTSSILFFAPIAGGMVLLTIFPVFFATLMAYCVTGYIRDELYAATVKNFIGMCCSFFVSPSLNGVCIYTYVRVCVHITIVMTMSPRFFLFIPQGMLINFIFFILWLLLLMALSALLTVFIQLKLSCNEIGDGGFEESTCLPRGSEL